MTIRIKKKMLAAGISVLGVLIFCLFTLRKFAYAEDDENDDVMYFKPASVHMGQQNVVKPANFSDDSKDPILLWWTSRLYIRPDLEFTECKNGHKCYLTADRKKLENPLTRGLLFYGTDIEPHDLPFPRLPHHEWALLHEESPMNIHLLQHGRFLNLFNHTATFKRESDFPLSSQSIINLEYLMERKPVSVEDKNKHRKDGFAPVLYVQSHCNVASYRDIYVQELMKYIQIDSYGKCLNNKDFKSLKLSNAVESMADPEFLDIISKYKFHLAFENALCDDYMTEKLFRVLHVGSVPIYRGSPLATDWMPNNKTIIMVDNFTTPEKLAEYIKYLDTHDSEYESYLEYKKKDGIKNKFLKDYIQNREWGCNDPYMPNFIESYECYVCEKVSERLKHEREMAKNSTLKPMPPRVADISHMKCPVPHKPFGIVDKGGDENIDWQEDYWSGMDRAKAVERMMKDGKSNRKLYIKYWDDVVREVNSKKNTKLRS